MAVRILRPCATLAITATITLAALCEQGRAQEAVAFEVASLRANTSGGPAGPATITPDGRVTILNTAIGALFPRAYPDLTTPIQIVNLPPWASERYDLIARGKAGSAPEELAQMFRSLLIDRLKLVAHYDSQERDGYDLTLARPDKRLGNGIKPSSLDCTGAVSNPPVPKTGEDPKTTTLKTCGRIWVQGNAAAAGGATLADLARLLTATAGRPVADRTGLAGYFEVELRHQRMQVTVAADGTDSSTEVSVFRALEEQLGLKLTPSKIQARILVIDHIERPTEN